MSVRPDTFFKFKKGRLHVENVDFEALKKKWGTPLYVYSAAALNSPIDEIKKAFGSHDHLVCFAVKANSNLKILSHLAKQGLGADVVSGGELEVARRAGIKSQKIVFSGVGKTREEILFALKQGIYSFQIESTEEWELIHSLAKNKTRYALRINPDVSAKTHPYISTGLKENKFGLLDSEVNQILREPKSKSAAYLGGVSIHIGSQILSRAPFEEAFKCLLKRVQKIEKTIGRSLEFVDVGGGLGVQYTDERTLSIQNWIGLAKRYFGHHRILIEPGRLIAANAGVLLTSVIRTKVRSGASFVVADAAMNDFMRPSLYQSVHRVLPHHKEHVSKKSVRLVGPVCESSDVLSQNARLSTQMKPGDLIAVLSAGAYGMSMASNYNSRTRPAEVFVSGKKMTLIRRREKSEDLLRTLI